MSEFKGQWANTENAPLIGHMVCRCPLWCPKHGENGIIPGDQLRPMSTPWADAEELRKSQPAPVDPYAEFETDPALAGTVSLTSVHRTPAAIVPVEIPNALEILEQEKISITSQEEQLYITQGDSCVTLSFESANALAQEILKARKRVELTLPETIETTLEAMKARVGPDMAPLVDLIRSMLESKKA